MSLPQQFQQWQPQHPNNPVSRFWTHFYRLSVDGLDWTWKKGKTGSILPALVERAIQQKHTSMVLLNHLERGWWQAQTQSLNRIVHFHPLYEVIELPWYYDYCSQFLLHQLRNDELLVYAEAIKIWQQVQREIQDHAEELAQTVLPKTLQTRIDKLPWKKPLALPLVGVHGSTIPLEGILELSIQCVLLTFSHYLSLDEVEIKLKSIFSNIMLPLEVSPWGLFGTPKMIFISSIEEGLLVGASGQSIGTNSREVKMAFGKKAAERIERIFKGTRRQLLMSMKGARHLGNLRKMISPHLTAQNEFKSPKDLDEQVSELANRATQKIDRSMHINRPGQSFHSCPLWERCGPCAKCRVIHQFFSPPSTNTELNHLAYEVPNCAEDAWELKRLLICAYTASQAERRHRIRERRRLMARFR